MARQGEPRARPRLETRSMLYIAGWGISQLILLRKSMLIGGYRVIIVLFEKVHIRALRGRAMVRGSAPRREICSISGTGWVDH
jgi:hypothetical protein